MRTDTTTEWEAAIEGMSNLHLAKVAYQRGDLQAASVRAMIVQAEATQRLAEVAETFFEIFTSPDAGQQLMRVIAAVEAAGYRHTD